MPAAEEDVVNMQVAEEGVVTETAIAAAGDQTLLPVLKVFDAATHPQPVPS